MSDVNNLTQQALNLEQAGVMSQGIGTAVGGVGSLATGIVGLIGSGQAIRDAESNLQAVKDAAPSLTTPTAYMDAVKNAYDQRLMTMRNEDINRALSSSVAAAGQYGARGLGMAMQAQNQAQANLRAEAEAQQKAQTAALTNLGAAQQNAQQMQEARYQSDLDLAYDERKAAQARQQQAIQGITQGVMGLATGGASTLLANAAFEEGGEIQKTPGEFSHDRNEMYIVDGDGESVGIAVTGGEYVVPPADAKALKEKSEQGNTPLHRFVRKMIKRFEDA